MSLWFEAAIRDGRVWMVGLVLALAACGGGSDGDNQVSTPPETSAPSITRQPEAQTVVEGAAAAFTVEATGDGLSYQWLRDGVAVADAARASLTLAAAAQTDSGSRWAVRVSNAKGSTLSQDALLTVVSAPPAPRLSLLSGDIGGVGNTDGAGRTARFNQISGIAADADGVIYVADTGNATLRKLMPDGRVSTLAGRAGETGTTDGQGHVARFTSPTDVLVMPDGTLLVADQDRLRRVTQQGVVSTLSTPGLPAALALVADRAGTVFISTGSSVWRMAPNAEPVSFAGFHGINTTWDGLRSNARFDRLTDLAITSDGTIYATQHYGEVRTISPQGDVRTVTDASGQAVTVQFVGGIAVDASDSLWISNPRTMLSKFRTTAEQVPAFDNSDELRLAMDSDLKALAFLPSGELAFAAAHGIAKLDTQGRYSEIAGSAFVASPEVGGGIALAADRDGRLVLAQQPPSGRINIRRLDAATGDMRPFPTEAGTVQVLTSDTTGRRSPARYPGLGVDASGKLLVAETYVRDASSFDFQASPRGGVIEAVSAQGERTLLSRWTANTGTLISPANLVTDRQGDAWFIDLVTERLVHRDAAGALSPWAAVGLTYDRGGPNPERVNIFPIVGASGQIYVASRAARTIARVERDRLVPWVGQSQVQGAADGPASSASFRLPGPGVVDSRGYLYVADGELVRRISPEGSVLTVAGTAGSVGIGTGPLPGTLGLIRSLALASDRVLVVLVDQAILRIDLPTTP